MSVGLTMSKAQEAILSYLQNASVELPKDDLYVSITLYHLPATLVRLFAQKVAYKYPGGVGEAVEDLIKKAVIEQL